MVMNLLLIYIVLSIKLGKFSGYESPIDIYIYIYSFEYKTWEV